ncbi:polyphosphate kinase [Vibrio ponticus]|nr:polyphosphate kinase [Vibrio ponticus]
MSSEKLYIEKELSWLSFNERVLQEAADKSVPLIERIRFLGIFSNNLDEFYKVRFADVKRRILINQERGGNDNSKHLLTKMQSKALKLNERFDDLYQELIREMARRRIFLVNEHQLSDTQKGWIQKYFRRQVLPHMSPVLLTEEIDLLQFLKDEYAYIAVELKRQEHTQYVLLEIPTDHLPRFVMVPEQKANDAKPLFCSIILFAIALMTCSAAFSNMMKSAALP